MRRHKNSSWPWRLRHYLIVLITLQFVQKEVQSEILSRSKSENLDVTQSSVFTSSVLTPASDSLQTTELSKRERTLKFVSELKNVTKEAGGFLRLRCSVTGSKPATRFEWFSNEAPLMEGK